MTKYLIKHLNRFLFIVSAIISFNGCNSSYNEFSKIEKYYTENISLHKKTSDSLFIFCKTYKTDVIIRKSNPGKPLISFGIHLGDTFYPIYYDSSLNRSDMYPDMTSKYQIPIFVISNFKFSIYTAISSDSIHTFFGGKWDMKFQIGTHGDAQYGILFSSDSNLSKLCEKRLSQNACVTQWTIP